MDGGRRDDGEPGDDAGGAMLDVAFPLAGTSLPRDHRRVLAEAVARLVPWLPEARGAGVHGVNVVPGTGERALLSHRTRLVLRVPRERAPSLGALAQRTLSIDGETLTLGHPRARELLPHGTLYAPCVVEGTEDEGDFLAAVDAELAALEVPCRRLCGRPQVLDGGARRLAGFSLMLYALSAADARRVLDTGLGRHRLYGCGLFVPHRSAAAVGA